MDKRIWSSHDGHQLQEFGPASDGVRYVHICLSMENEQADAARDCRTRLARSNS